MSKAVGFLVGAGAGFMLGILTAPQSGEATRRKIQSGAEDGVRAVKQGRLRMRRWASRFKKDSARVVTTQENAVKAALSAGKRAYLRVVG